MHEEKENLTEERVSEITLEELKNDPEGAVTYPILDFDAQALRLLTTGVQQTLRYCGYVANGGRGYRFFKRFFDIIISIIALILSSIPIGICSLIIVAEDGHSPIFSQIRLTENGKTFRMYKLRSMCYDAEEKFADIQDQNERTGVVFKVKDDPRVTRIGKFIRKTSMDELPQFWNVLRGDMSLIGPRPPLPREVVLYTPEQMERLLVKGGISCVCQTLDRNQMTFNDWVETDIEYVKTRSFWGDVKLLFKTAIAVITRKGSH